MDKMNNTSKQAISEKTLTVITAIQAVMLAAYGMFALLLHHRMMSYDLYSVGNAGSPVHFCYVVTMLTGAFLIIYRLIKDRKSEGFLKSQGFLVPLAVTGTAFIFKQANTVYTSTEGGSLFGLIGYLFSAGLSGSDPIDEFVYGRMTILKYLFVMGIGAVCAALTIVRLLENNNRRISLESINSEAIRTKANAAAAAGSDYINKASRMASAAAEAVKQAAGEDGSSKDINVDDSADNLIINDGVDASAKKSDRAKNVVIGVLIAALIAGGAAVYSEFFAFTKYELSDFTTGVFVEGYSGEAAALEPSINYEMLYDLDYEDALHLEEVLETVEYRITPNEDLSNGDKIRIEG